MKKKLVSSALAATLMLSLIPISGLAAQTESNSGDPNVTRLTREQILRLLEDHPLNMPYEDEKIFDEMPVSQPPYAPGRVKTQWLQAAAGRLNVMRRLAALPPVELSMELSEEAQYGAVICEVVGMDHHPAKPADMSEEFYEIAYGATSSSNLGSGYSLTGVVDGWMDDSDSRNIGRLGHRRWLLNPVLGKIGFGYAGSMTSGKVFDTSGSGCDYQLIAWPASGHFPVELMEGQCAWSVTLNPDRYGFPHPDQIQVKLVRESDGKTWVFSKADMTQEGEKFFNVNGDGYGVSNCIVFRPDGVEQYSGTYRVEITGLTDAKGQPSDPISYQVTFFDTEDVYPEEHFQDVDSEGDRWQMVHPDYFAIPVRWALSHQITKGTSETAFSPDMICSRGEIITFLWRAAGSPEPQGSGAFSDVGEGLYYSKAVSWAAENGLEQGGTFSPDAPCTREMAMEFMWKLAGSPKAEQKIKFQDVAETADYAPAVSWAVEQGITTGTSETTFSPEQTCTRAQIVTFLYRNATTL